MRFVCAETCPSVLWTSINFEDCFTCLWNLEVLPSRNDNWLVDLLRKVSHFQSTFLWRWNVADVAGLLTGCRQLHCQRHPVCSQNQTKETKSATTKSQRRAWTSPWTSSWSKLHLVPFQSPVTDPSTSLVDLWVSASHRPLPSSTYQEIFTGVPPGP